MPYQFFYIEEARADVKRAKNWYKEQKNGLEKEFAEVIEL